MQPRGVTLARRLPASLLAEWPAVASSVYRNLRLWAPQVEEMDLDFNEGMMLLPITAEHTIDERSPLWGHSHDSLQVPPPLFT